LAKTSNRARSPLSISTPVLVTLVVTISFWAYCVLVTSVNKVAVLAHRRAGEQALAVRLVAAVFA
jgi:hypothetical protein